MAVSVSHGSEDSRSYSGGKKTVRFDLSTMRAYTEAMLSSIKGRITVDTIRPLPMFFGITGSNFCLSPGAFAPPVKKIDKSTPEKFKSRLKLNFAFFLSNYAVVAAGVCLVVALMHPGMLVASGMCWGLWSFHYFMISNEVIVFGYSLGTVLSITQRSAALWAVTLLVVVWKCLVPTITAVSVSAIFILSHAIMRDPKNIDLAGAKDSDSEEHSSDSEVIVERPQVRSDLA